MRQNAQNFLLFVGLATVAGLMFHFGEKWFFPPKPKPPAPLTVKQELVGALGGGGVLAVPPYDALALLPLPKPAEPPKPLPPPKAVEVKPSEPRALIALGNESFFLKVLLTNQGAGVQQ